MARPLGARGVHMPGRGLAGAVILRFYWMTGHSVQRPSLLSWADEVVEGHTAETGRVREARSAAFQKGRATEQVLGRTNLQLDHAKQLVG